MSLTVLNGKFSMNAKQYAINRAIPLFSIQKS